MLSLIKSIGLLGINGYIVEIESDISSGMPCFEIVGLPDAAIKESKERVRSALKNSGLPFPSKRYVINLAPADIKKEGVVYDVPIAIGICASLGIITIENPSDCMFLGELSLDGNIRKINGVLPAVITARQNGIKAVFVPCDNAHEAATVEGIEVLSCKHLVDIIKHFTKEAVLSPMQVDIKQYFEPTNHTGPDFSEVKGQESVKRALEIAAAGGHNVLLIGPPGSGKTMLAKRIPGILPPLSFNEALEVTKIHSIAGVLPEKTPIMTNRPFRSPHHTVSAVGLSGGGRIPRPGEISLAHNGVLFLDELPEFKKDSLEALRQPLEDGSITISRAHSSLSYPCNVMFIASMNPCPCGFRGDPGHACTCTDSQVDKYRSRISGPLLDRIDIHIEVNAVEYKDLDDKTRGQSSAQTRASVTAARAIQLDRFKESVIYSNARMEDNQLETYCVLGKSQSNLMKNAFDTLGLSARAYSRILKLSRTIADLAGSEPIENCHIAEAIQYRSLDRK